MDNDEYQCLSVRKAISDLQSTLIERFKEFRTLSKSIQVLTTQMEAKQSESSKPDGGAVNVYAEQRIRFQAQKVQKV